MMNTDESSMVVSNGNIRVVGSADTLKHEKVIDENRDISSLRVGSYAGVNGPRIYMTKGVKMDMETLRGDFVKKHNALPGSGVYATPNAYLNGETCRHIAPALCDRIYIMPVVRVTYTVGLS